MIIIDRIEENIAVCYNDDEKVEIDILFLPVTAKEGDVLVIENNIYRIDEAETENRRKKIKEKQDLLFKKKGSC